MSAPPHEQPGEFDAFLSDVQAAVEEALDTTLPDAAEEGAATSATEPDRWFHDPEKVCLDWLALDDRLMEEPG